MQKSIALFAIVMVSMSQAALFPSLTDIAKDFQWTQAINNALCAPGGHSDAVAQQFYACYNEAIVPGATQFKACQTTVFGLQMNSQANIDAACAAASQKLPLYAACILARLPLQGVCPTTAIHKLNVCQGKAVGVPPPA